MRLSASQCGAWLLCLLAVLLGTATAQEAEQAEGGSPSVGTAQEAYREVLGWACGIAPENIPGNQSELDKLFERVERGAYRHGIIPEFALAILAAEASYGSRISWARYDSWTMYELTTGINLPRYPLVLDDLDTALSELWWVMSNAQTLPEVLEQYWSGPHGEFNQDSLEDFATAVGKLWGGLEPYATARKANEDRSKYDRLDDAPAPSEPAWAGLAYGDLEGYSSALGSMPMLAKQLKSFPQHEEAYVKVAQHFNSSLSDAQALVIVRAILTYCQQTSYGAQTEFWVDPRFVMAVVAAESRFKPRAVSKKGAMGLGQLMPATAKSLGIRDAFDPIQNLYGCVKYIEREKYRWRDNGNWLDLVIASYNAGAGAVNKYGGVPTYRETQSFVKIVKGYYDELLAPKRKGN